MAFFFLFFLHGTSIGNGQQGISYNSFIPAQPQQTINSPNQTEIVLRALQKSNTMRSYKKELEKIASDLLEQNANAKGDENKPNYSNRDFMNALIIFQTALMDKMYDNQSFDQMPVEHRLAMANSCGTELRKLIHTYTGLDTHDVEKFV